MKSSELIFYLGTLGGIFYIVYMFVMQRIKGNQRKKELMLAKQEYDLVKRQKDDAKKELISSIASVYGIEKAEKVANETIWIGMPSFLLLAAIGKAHEIKESFYKGVSKEKWYFGDYQTRLGTTKHKLEVTLENSEVVGWRDLV